MIEVIENMDYDSKIGRPTRYAEIVTSLANMASKAKEPDLFLAMLDSVTTPEILSFNDQLSKESAEQLKKINVVVKEVIQQRNSALSVENEMSNGKGLR